MARNWKDVRAEAVADGQLSEERIAEHAKRLRTEQRASRLSEIREGSGMNQVTIATRLGISQSRVSRIEHGDIDHAELATVRAYIAALGGEVEVVVKFGDERMTIA
jgi:predicted XRE-type DNA-binding protein